MFISKICALSLLVGLAPIWLNLGYTAYTTTTQQTDSPSDAIVVFGASIINNNYPSKVLELRLDTAYELFTQKQAPTIIVSGDTRNSNYNEPRAMYNYLIQKGVPADLIVQDTGGVGTLATCQRLKHVFKLNSAVLVSQDFHLPRAHLLCSAVGINTSLAAAPSSSENVTITGTIREYPALLYNIGLLIQYYLSGTL